jgi:hypothetical protein
MAHNTPTGDLTDEQLRELGGSRAAGELARRAAARGRERQAEPIGRERIRQIMQAHAVGGRDLRNHFEQMAAGTPRSEAAEGDRSLHAGSLQQAAAVIERSVQRAYAAIERDHERAVTAREGAPVAASATGGWEALTARAHAEQARHVIGENERQFDYVDPDDIEAENRRLGTPGAHAVARARP